MLTSKAGLCWCIYIYPKHYIVLIKCIEIYECCRKIYIYICTNTWDQLCSKEYENIKQSARAQTTFETTAKAKWTSETAHERTKSLLKWSCSLWNFSMCVRACVCMRQVYKICVCVCAFFCFRYAFAWRKYSNEHKIVVFKHNKCDSNNTMNGKCVQLCVFVVNYTLYVHFIHRNMRLNAKIGISNNKY